MKVIIILLLFVSSCLSLRIAVLDFKVTDISSADADTVHSSVVAYLTNMKVYQLIDRKFLEDIIKEQNMQITEYNDVEYAVKVGKLVGAEYIIIGSISKMNEKFIMQLNMVDVEKGYTLAHGETSSSQIYTLRDNAPIAIYDLLSDMEVKDREVLEVGKEYISIKAGRYDGVLPGMKVKLYRSKIVGGVSIPEDITTGDVIDVGDEWCKVSFKENKNVQVIPGDLAQFDLKEFYSRKLSAPTTETTKTSKTNIYTVPRLIGLNLSEAEDILSKVGYHYKVDYIDTEDNSVNGRVLSQNPPSGKDMEKGGVVEIVVGRYIEPKIKLPNVVGMDIGQAETKLKDLGLDVSILYQDTNKLEEVDKVLSQNPKEGENVKTKTKVDISIGQYKIRETPNVLFDKAYNELYLNGKYEEFVDEANDIEGYAKYLKDDATIIAILCTRITACMHLVEIYTEIALKENNKKYYEIANDYRHQMDKDIDQLTKLPRWPEKMEETIPKSNFETVFKGDYDEYLRKVPELEAQALKDNDIRTLIDIYRQARAMALAGYLEALEKSDTLSMSKYERLKKEYEKKLFSLIKPPDEK